MDYATCEMSGDVAVIAMDDGKANAFGPGMIAAVDALLDRASAAKAVVVTGRDGILSGGFDLNVIRGGDPVAARAMNEAGVRLMMRLYGLPQPLVIAATGHAIALGGFLLLTGDRRIGADGDFRIGLNETAIGMSLPPFGLMLARERLSKRYLTRSALAANLYPPAGAREAGFLDEVTAPERLRDAALAAATELAALDAGAYAATKASLRGGSIAAVLADID